MSSATVAKTSPPAPDASAAVATRPSTNAFVINLVSSTTPVALTRPDHAGLKRFTFFVSRRREDGRERFRLHMGYFDTQEEAEQLLDIVRTIYPGAWAGAAPGRRLAQAAEAQATEAQSPGPVVSAPAPAPTSAAPKVRTVVPGPVAAASRVDEPKAAVVTPPSTRRTTPAAAAVTEVAAVPQRAIEMTASGLALVPDEARRPLADVGDAPTAARAEAPPTAEAPRAVEAPRAAEHQAARHSLHNIRAAIASLEDSGIHSPVLDALPTLAPAIIPVAQPAQAGNSVDPTSTLSNTATLRLLESGAATREPADAAPVAPTVKVPTVSAARKAAPAPTPQTEKPCYAVQLVWSVQPIDTAEIPQLAIFGAYTLYGAEGNRDGRRWYGLRLGFFTDAVSAKQVAQYVRGDFATVSVVPVTTRERDQALKSTGVEGAASGRAAAKPSNAARRAAADNVHAVPSAANGAKAGVPAQKASKATEFAFIEGTEATMPKNPPGTATGAGVPAPGKSAGVRMIGGRPTRGAPGKRAKVRKPGQVNAHAAVKPKTLEETLEILGANQLKVDDEPGATLNDSGVRHLRLENKGRPSKLSRLIGRLSERMGS